MECFIDRDKIKIEQMDTIKANFSSTTNVPRPVKANTGRHKDLFRRSLVVTSIADGSNRDLLKELKKFGTAKKIVPYSVNDFTGSSDIANAFADKNRNLYSEPTVPHEIQAPRSDILEYISSYNEHELEGISVADICSAITELKHQKSDGLRGTSSDHFIYCSHKFKVLIALMVNSMFVHGYTPNDLLESVLTSIQGQLVYWW